MTSQPRFEVGRKFRPSSAVTSLPVGPLRSATSALARTMWRRQRSCLRRGRPHHTDAPLASCASPARSVPEHAAYCIANNAACGPRVGRAVVDVMHLGAVGEHRGHRSPAGRRRAQSTPLRCSDVCSMVPISVRTDAGAHSEPTVTSLLWCLQISIIRYFQLWTCMSALRSAAHRDYFSLVQQPAAYASDYAAAVLTKLFAPPRLSPAQQAAEAISTSIQAARSVSDARYEDA